MRIERHVALAGLFTIGTLAAGLVSCGAQLREEPAADAAAPIDAATNVRACTAHDDCKLRSATCCGVCGSPQVNDMTAVRWDREAAYRDAVCGPGPVACPACAAMTNPHLTALCRAGTCVAIDVRTDAVGACVTDADCTLRFGTACCELCSGNADQLTAIPTAAIATIVRCMPNEGACPDCLPRYPRGARAACNPQTRRCEVLLR
jgi:hypothetical protein